MSSKKQIERFWSANVPWIETFNQYGELPLGERYEITDKVRESVEPYSPRLVREFAERGKTVLEVGCGFGSDLRQFAKCGMIPVGIDLSPDNARLSHSGLKSLNLVGEVIVADAEHLPFVDEAFDNVYSSGVLHHTPDTKTAIAEIYRTLRTGGSVLIMLYHKGLAWYWINFRYGILNLDLIRKNREEMISKRYDNTYLSKMYSKNDATHLLSNFDSIRFEVINFGGIRFHPIYKYVLVIFKRFPWLEKRLGSMLFIFATKSQIKETSSKESTSHVVS